jgi:hypothetical protein
MSAKVLTDVHRARWRLMLAIVDGSPSLCQAPLQEARSISRQLPDARRKAGIRQNAVENKIIAKI